MSASCPRPVVVFSEDASQAPMQQALKAGVSAYVIAGLQPQRLLPVLQVAIARFEQDRALRGQLETAQSPALRAQGVREGQGHPDGRDRPVARSRPLRHLRKLAMDRGQRLAQVAERVVEARDLLKPPG